MGRKNMISVVLTVTWLLMPDGLVEVFQKLQISGDFRAWTEKKKAKNHIVSS